jgi:flagellar protein FliO/FliZ
MEATVYIRFVLSLILVLGLILAALWAVRRYGFGPMMVRPSGRRRLALVEAMPLDAKRRLVLIRRDDREHLLLLGGGADLVVESGIDVPRFELPAPPTEAQP